MCQKGVSTTLVISSVANREFVVKHVECFDESDIEHMYKEYKEA